MEEKKFVCECGRSFDKIRGMTGHQANCQIHKNAVKQKKEARRLPNGMFKCENPDCGKEHDGNFGSGRFCSKHCAQSFSAKSQNVITLDKMNSGLCNNCSSNNIRQFLISSNLKKNQCEICGLSIWQGKILTT